MIHSFTFWVIVIFAIFAIVLICYGIFHKDKCPYCGSENTVLDYIIGNSNWGIWHMHCKDCLREFEINGINSSFYKKKKNG